MSLRGPNLHGLGLADHLLAISASRRRHCSIFSTTAKELGRVMLVMLVILTPWSSFYRH